jgi:hypothetical protein
MMHEERTPNLWIDAISKEVLIRRIPILDQLVGIRIIESPKRESCSGCETPETPEKRCRMFDVIANGMCHTGRGEKLPHSPPVSPTDSAIGIPHEHRLDTRLIDREESNCLVLRTEYVRRSKTHRGTDSKSIHERLGNVGGNIDVHTPRRKVMPNQSDVFKEAI